MDIQKRLKRFWKDEKELKSQRTLLNYDLCRITNRYLEMRGMAEDWEYLSFEKRPNGGIWIALQERNFSCKCKFHHPETKTLHLTFKILNELS
jgi:hypothetical protein